MKAKSVLFFLGIFVMGVFLSLFFYRETKLGNISFSFSEIGGVKNTRTIQKNVKNLITENPKESEKIEEEEKTYTLLFTGDIMLDRGVKTMTERHGGGDYNFPFLNIYEDLRKADLLFGNLESMISDKGRDLGGLYSFRADPRAMSGLSFAGFDIVSLANNHTFDYGREAFEDTMKRLTKEEIAYTGAGFSKEEVHSPAIINLDETKVGFLGYTTFLYPYAFATNERSGITDFSLEKMKEDIKNAKNKVDFLAVTFHYGDEYQKKPNENQILLSQRAIDYGADVVIGHHPHVTQPVEKYEEKYIAYSLGNFVFDQYFSEETMSGFMLEMEIKESGEVIEASKVYYRLNDYYQPKVTKREKISH